MKKGDTNKEYTLLSVSPFSELKTQIMKGSIIMKLFKKHKEDKKVFAFGLIPDEPDSRDLYWEDTKEYKEMVNNGRKN